MEYYCEVCKLKIEFAKNSQYFIESFYITINRWNKNENKNRKNSQKTNLRRQWKMDAKVEISEAVKYVGVNDYEIDLFEGQYKVPNGMAYNSYAIINTII